MTPASSPVVLPETSAGRPATGGRARVAASVVAVLLGLMGGAWAVASSVESSLRERVQEALPAAGVVGTEVEYDGRHAVVRNVRPGDTDTVRTVVESLGGTDTLLIVPQGARP